MSQFYLIPSDNQNVTRSASRLADNKYLITVSDSERKFLCTMVINKRKAHLWDTLMCEYGVDAVNERLKNNNVVVHKDQKDYYTLLEISDEPFVHTEETISHLHNAIAAFAASSEDKLPPSTTEGLQHIVVGTTSVQTPHTTQTHMIDVVCRWSAFSTNLSIRGVLRHGEEVSGIDLSSDKATMYLPIINRWEESLRMGTVLMMDRYKHMISEAYDRAFSTRASLQDCDDVRAVIEHALYYDSHSSARIRTHAAVGKSIFDYDTVLDEVYDFNELSKYDAAEIRTIKYYAPSHLSRGHVIEYLLKMSSITKSISAIKRLVNRMLFEQRTVSLEHKTAHEVI